MAIEETRFAAGKSYRICTALGACLVSIFFIGLLSGYMGATMYGVPFGIALAMYFTYPVYIVKPGELVFEFGFGKRPFAFNQGPFRLERLRGFKSYMQSFRRESYLLRVTGQKNRGIALLLNDGEVAALIAKMREAGAVVEGGTPGPA